MTATAFRIPALLACVALTIGAGSAASAQTPQPEEKLGLAPPRLETSESGQTIIRNDAAPVRPGSDYIRETSPIDVTGMLQREVMAGFGFRFGAYLADSPQSRGRNGRMPALLGISYRLPFRGARLLQDTDVYLDAGGGLRQTTLTSTTFQDFSRENSFLGIGLSRQYSRPLSRGHGSAYVGAGGGLYRVETVLTRERLTNEGESVTGIVNGNSHMSFRTGYKVFGGVQFRHGLFLEAAYNHVGSYQGVPLNGVSLSFGLRTAGRRINRLHTARPKGANDAPPNSISM